MAHPRSNLLPTASLALLAGALATLVALPGALAAADADAPWALAPRTLSFTGDDAGLRFTSERATATDADTWSGSWDAARATLTTELKASRPDPADLGLRLDWVALVVYRDADGDGAYGPADAALRTTPLAGLPVQVAPAPVDQAPAAEATYTLPALDPATADLLASSTPSAPATQDGGRLTVRVALAGDPDPLALALSATAHGVPLPAPDARLALLVRSASTSPAPPASSPREAALGPGRATWSDGAVRLALAWDGAGSRWSGPDGAVLSALDLGAGERAAAGTLRAEREAAEPMTTIAAPTGDLGLYGAGLAAVAVALGAPSLLRLRRA